MCKIKICYLISSLCNEGPVNVIYNILQFINFARFDVSIVTLNPEKTSTRIQEFRKLPIRLEQLSATKKISLFSQYVKLTKVLKDIKPDIIHGHCSGPLYLMNFLPYKTVYTIHIYPGVQNIALSGWFKGNIIIRLDNYFTKKCDAPICCSESIAEKYLREKGLKYLAIPNGTSYKVWHFSEGQKQILRKQLGLENNKKYFIFVGRFSKEKHPEILVKAFAKRHDVGLIMLGIGPLWESLFKIKTGNIIMPGFTTKVADYLRASDYYISSSDIEGLANTILESMSVGLPMLLSNIPSHQEIVRNIPKDTIVSYFMDNHSEIDIIRKVDAVLKIDTDNARNVIQNIFKKYYTAEIMTNKYEEVYDRLI